MAAMLLKGKISIKTPEEKVRGACKALAAYRREGNGLKALKICRIYVKNARDKGENDVKYRRINKANNAFKTKVAAFTGGKQLLYAAGFEKGDATEEFPSGKLEISVKAIQDKDFLTKVVDIIEEEIGLIG
eukprot:g3322.t1